MSCGVCGESRFANFAQRKCHESKNHAEFSCSCNKRFMDQKSLEQHQRDMLSSSKEFPCSNCCRSFRTAEDMHQHKRSKMHWSPGEREQAEKETGRVFCDDRCGRSFKSASALDDHKRDVCAKHGISDTTCRGCGKSFFNSDRLDQHRKDTGHSKKSAARAKEYLNNFHKSNIALSRVDKKESVQVVEKILRRIMDHVYKADGGRIYCPNATKAGSYPTKTKIGKADEFDTNIPCNITPDNVRTRGDMHHAYEPLDKKMGTSNNMNIPMEMKDLPNGKPIPMGYAAVGVKEGSVPSKLTHNGEIIPRELKRDLYGKMDKAIKELGLKDAYLSRNAHGPALTMNIHQGNGRHYISVDVTLSIPCDVPITDNGWPRPDTLKAFKRDVINEVIKTGTHLVPKGDEVWAVSCSKAEKILLSKIDGGNGCRREVNRIMKKQVQTCSSRTGYGLPGVSSHIIKHEVLWSAERHPDPEYWSQGNVVNCLVDTMGDMATALNKGKLPDYFNTSVNILKGKDPEVLRQLGDYFMGEREKLLHM